MASSAFSKRPRCFCTRPSNWLYVQNQHKWVFSGTKNFLHSANLQAIIRAAGFLQVLPMSSSKKLLLGTGLRQLAKMSTSLKSPDGLKDAECEKGSCPTSRPFCMYLWLTLSCPRKNLNFSKSSFRTVPPQYAQLLPWEQWGIPCTHCCNPPYHCSEGAAQEVQDACQGCCKAVWGVEESPRSSRFSRNCLNKRWCYGLQGGDWADSTDAPRIPEGSWQGNCLDVQATEETAVRWHTVPMRSHLPWDAQAWLVGCSKWSSEQR